MQKGNYAQARADVNKALQLDPDHQGAIDLSKEPGMNAAPVKESPMSGQEYAESFHEQDGYALVQGRRLHYWLYDTYTDHNGNSEVIHNQIVPHWVEKMGYKIDYDDVEEYNPNDDLAASVKTLMTQRGCDVSFTLISSGGSDDYVVFNEYSKSEGIYRTTIYPLSK
jgi:hypothetical protein